MKLLTLDESGCSPVQWKYANLRGKHPDWTHEKCAKTAGFKQVKEAIGNALENNPSVQYVIARRLEELQMVSEFTAELVMREAYEVYQEARADDQLKTALQALELIGKGNGMFSTKVALDMPVDLIVFNMGKGVSTPVDMYDDRMIPVNAVKVALEESSTVPELDVPDMEDDPREVGEADVFKDVPMPGDEVPAFEVEPDKHAIPPVKKKRGRPKKVK